MVPVPNMKQAIVGGRIMDKLLTAKEAANLLGVSQAYLSKLRSSGNGPVYMDYGWSVRYHPNDISEWLASRRRTSTAGLLKRKAKQLSND
jgi:excisionase family DNA binding protein